MPKAEEQVVDIKVTTDDLNNYQQVKDLDYSLSTGSGNEAKIETDLINGKLDSIIINTSKECEVLITFAEIPIVVFSERQFKGLKYIPIRLQTITPDNQLLLSGSSCFYLNNKLKIKIMGSGLTDVDITLRVI